MMVGWLIFLLHLTLLQQEAMTIRLPFILFPFHLEKSVEVQLQEEVPVL